MFRRFVSPLLALVVASGCAVDDGVRVSAGPPQHLGRRAVSVDLPAPVLQLVNGPDEAGVETKKPKRDKKKEKNERPKTEPPNRSARRDHIELEPPTTARTGQPADRVRTTRARTIGRRVPCSGI